MDYFCSLVKVKIIKFRKRIKKKKKRRNWNLPTRGIEVERIIENVGIQVLICSDKHYSQPAGIVTPEKNMHACIEIIYIKEHNANTLFTGKYAHLY